MRLSEVIGLKWSYVRDGLAVIPMSQTKWRRRVTSQGAKEKVVVLMRLALGLIEPYRAKKAADGFVFPMARQDPRVISKAIIELRDDLGAPRISTIISSGTPSLRSSPGWRTSPKRRKC